MRREQQEPITWDIEDWAEWPEPQSEIDDEEFARAIAEGRGLEVAA